MFVAIHEANEQSPRGVTFAKEEFEAKFIQVRKGRKPSDDSLENRQ